MLPEQHATSYSHDAAIGKVVVVTDHPLRSKLHGDVHARVLLDGRNHLVGIDVAPDTDDRLVVMLGPHESVDHVEEGSVHVENGARMVTILGHAAKVIAPGANPWVF